ncbi:MAG TPA: hypothetical protein DHV15_09635 [Treponema sp.]|uniref:Uncharacterized protein n=1 Tax=Treponema denticola (strain ATCC 35405 / DSM 14222 / CIP 103919 / JCM 8153 / KCTC 15104) TaxID=243275 RepID=Q73RB2_TREDE|nr:hypothetical protein TDE_0179 [Treponema denticola ATCC 35405]HCY95751.1 hypothetical protein [Treponema sp.]
MREGMVYFITMIEKTSIAITSLLAKKVQKVFQKYLA